MCQPKALAQHIHYSLPCGISFIVYTVVSYYYWYFNELVATLIIGVQLVLSHSSAVSGSPICKYTVLAVASCSGVIWVYSRPITHTFVAPLCPVQVSLVLVCNGWGATASQSNISTVFHVILCSCLASIFTRSCSLGYFGSSTESS